MSDDCGYDPMNTGKPLSDETSTGLRARNMILANRIEELEADLKLVEASREKFRAENKRLRELLQAVLDNVRMVDLMNVGLDLEIEKVLRGGE